MKKNLQQGPWIYLVVFVCVAAVMALYEFIKELIFQGTLTPWQSHTITIFVTAVLATLVARIIRNWSDNILKREQVLRLQEQKLHTLTLVLRAVHHIVNNFLNHFLLIKGDLVKTGTVKAETLTALDASIQEVCRQLGTLEDLKEPDQEESYREIFPK